MKTPPLDTHPWPPPRFPWIMVQTWNDLIFAHWPISPDVMRPLIPAGLTLDTYEGQAWIGVVPFWMSGVRPRWVPAIPKLSVFPELNVRTYITTGDKPGVYFFSLDAANPLAVDGARRFYHLPYFNAQMKVNNEGDWIDYSSHRTDHRGRPADLRCRYRPTGSVYYSSPGTLEDWLTARYCLYAVDRHQRLYRGEIHHIPWPLQPAEMEIEVNTMAQAAGITLPDISPVLHFSKRLEVVVWPLESV